jgi:tetratricopeptide (TPR) repeat protein
MHLILVAWAFLLSMNLVWAGDDASKADKLARRADLAFEQNHPRRAARLAERVLRQDPGNLRALMIRGAWRRELALAASSEAERNRLVELSNQDLRRILVLGPGTFSGALARGYLELDKPVLDLPEPNCPAAATASFQAAEELYVRRRFDEALREYEEALAGCPKNSLWLTYAGDAWYGMGDKQKAIRLYQQALEVDPFNWVARRFLGDVLLKTGAETEGIAEIIASVACNPSYTTGWAQMRGILAQVGSGVPVQVNKAERILEANRPHDAPSPVDLVWRTYTEARVRAREEHPSDTPLQGEERAVRAALEVARPLIAANPDEEGLRPWALLDRMAGGTDFQLAILVLLPDREIAPAFIERRNSDFDAVFRFVAGVVVLGKTDPDEEAEAQGGEGGTAGQPKE